MFNQTKHLPFFPVVLFVAIFVLAACGSQPAASAAAPAAANTAAPAAPTAADQAAASSSTNSAGGTVSFSKDILPILENSCVSCHGGEKTSKGLDVKTYTSLMAGSDHGAVINPGDAAGSPLIRSIVSGKMPKRGAKLTADQVQLLETWVNAGAPNN